MRYVIRLLVAAIFTCSAAEAVEAPPVDGEIGIILARWEAESANLEQVPEAARRRAWYVHRSRHSGHELAVMLEFRGPVRADELRERYRWTGVERQADRLVLTAEPREAVERLFYRNFRLALDPETFLPVSLQFADRRGASHPEPVKLVTHQKLSPPGAERLQTADLHVFADRSPLTLRKGASTRGAWRLPRDHLRTTLSPIQPAGYERVADEGLRLKTALAESALPPENSVSDWQQLLSQLRMLKARLERFFSQIDSGIEANHPLPPDDRPE